MYYICIYVFNVLKSKLYRIGMVCRNTIIVINDEIMTVYIYFNNCILCV